MAKVCPKHDVLGDTCWNCEQEKKKAKAPVAVKPATGVKVFSNPGA